MLGSDCDEYAVIEFVYNGECHKFTSGYGGTGNPKIGDRVTVYYDPETSLSEYYSFSNRWVFTLGSLGFAVFFGLITYAGLK